ncbi:unnamed protein product [Lathyrus sativus]
MLRKH